MYLTNNGRCVTYKFEQKFMLLKVLKRKNERLKDVIRTYKEMRGDVGRF